MKYTKMLPSFDFLYTLENLDKKILVFSSIFL